MDEKLDPKSQFGATVGAPGSLEEREAIKGHFTVEVFDENGAFVERREFDNTVVTVGKNDLLDKYLAGSAYTAAFFMGLITDASFSAISAADTMASHAGWLEGGTAHDPVITNATRPAPSFSAASAGSKATSAAVVFTINTNVSTAKVKGAFVTTNSTIDGTTGILLSAGLFSGGDLTVLAGYTVNVSWSLAV